MERSDPAAEGPPVAEAAAEWAPLERSSRGRGLGNTLREATAPTVTPARIPTEAALGAERTVARKLDSTEGRHPNRLARENLVWPCDWVSNSAP